MGYPRNGIHVSTAPAPSLGSSNPRAVAINPARTSLVARHHERTDIKSLPQALQRLQTLVRRVKDPETRNSPGWNGERMSIGFELIDLVCQIFPETTKMSDDPAMELLVAFAEIAERDARVGKLQHEVDHLKREISITKRFVPENHSDLLRKALIREELL